MPASRAGVSQTKYPGKPIQETMCTREREAEGDEGLGGRKQ